MCKEQKELQEQEKQGHFNGLILLLSLGTHILSLTGPKAKDFKPACVCVCVRPEKVGILPLTAGCKYRPRPNHVGLS